MIFVCEPQCKGFSHEKFNSGFLHGLRLAFPDQPIRFYGDASHIAALQNILVRADISPGNIKYVPVAFRTSPGLLRLAGYQGLLSRLLKDVQAAGTDKVFFLSFNAEILWLLKRLKEMPAFRDMKFTLVLHGAFENVAEDDDTRHNAASSPLPGERTLLERIRRSRPTDLPLKALRLIQGMAGRTLSPWSAVSRRFFREKQVLLWKHSDDFHYICLSPHIMQNARRYLDVGRLNFHMVTLPTIFAAEPPPPRNSFPKFAMFGYGDSIGLRQLLRELSNRKIAAPYEIRVIGMNNRGIEDFPNVTCPGAGKPLERSEMEYQARDIDMFLIFYDKSRYRLSCSGSIMEALSYLKPVLHLDNDCINNFNKEGEPVGIRCDDISMMADKLQEIAEDYASHSLALDVFRHNMLEVRRECAIERSIGALRASFTWAPSSGTVQ